ncbi:MAG TPA: alpha/beta hydrolase [Steroidobacteraceae bacterium]|nr:alpha/beta hydrolase [Steroidobacteraceae bacterium]
MAFLAANLPAAFGAYTRRSDVAFGADPRQRLDVYVPHGSAPARPVIVFWHGGRWSHGDKRDYRFVGAALAQLGYVTVVPNYRLYPQVKMAGFMHDTALAASWAAAYAREFHDPDRLVLMGHSAGAQLAALAALDHRHFAAAGCSIPRIAGVIGLSGAYDFLPLLEADLQDMFGPAERLALSQPLNFVRADAPPMLLVHGAADETVWPKNSRNLAAALEACGVAVTLRLYPHLTHADTIAALSIPARRRAPVLREIAAFVGGLPRAGAVGR